ncbi:TonB-dependent receptor plug domain-containing protein [Massilia sp. CCM 8695]|uniref:TonB-dependent receptor plug domain-containing protein n=1 Tax=Massilia frigida TaxID=2609281 RepID=A0ABX0ND26_9BURK|nr:TonB-dependent receptor [Massilia frigida]NHZ83357.1 TonB-dependent receptor plug domain-containing protein [Massilia frigida]
MKPLYLSVCLAAAGGAGLNAHAQSDAAQELAPHMKVIVSAIGEGLQPRSSGAGDTALLLSSTAGYSVAQGGGVSGLPFVNGLGDDRLKIRIDGMEITSACANHMNAPLSNIASSQVGRIEVLAGVTPVSAGGDSIGGTITVKSAAPVFAKAGEALRTGGKLVLSGRSNGEAVNAGVSATVASDSMSFGYNAAYSHAHSYEDGDGRRVAGSLYESINQSAVLALREQNQQLTMRVGTQRIPYQGFPNQFMDMTGNDGKFANAGYAGKFGWGELDASAYWQSTDHEMGFFSPERPGNMPMLTQGRNAGYALQATLPLSDASTLRLGQEFHRFRLDDFWPAVAGSMMMGPNTYININDGRRDRVALFGEAETRHDARWTSLLGARWESVRMDAGVVQPYAQNMMNAADAAAAAAFNAAGRSQRDRNLDLTALARFEADAGSTYELAAARKTRSPNLYERYSWGRGTMAMTMTNWFGDGNGYVGKVDLKPETATTLGFTAHWRGAGGPSSWFVKLNPYYNRVQDYIDVDVVGQFTPYRVANARRALLRFANHDARLYGANLSWSMPLASSGSLGSVKFGGNAAYTRGKRADGGDLYHIMPFNALLTLEHSNGAWNSRVESKLVARKERIDARRLEPETAGYALLGARTSYQMRKNVQLTAAVSNLLDKAYAEPLGGVYLSGLRAAGALQPLPGHGRSVELGLSVGF